MKKFLCDHMCGELGRWLRIAGYDTAIPDALLKDQQIFKKAIEEKRLLLTRDKYFLEIDRDRKTVFYLHGESLDEWAKQLKEEANINWLYCPFSRCLRCNTEFEKIASPVDVPNEILKTTKDFWYCATCHQTFWRGSHTEHMEKQLRAWRN